MEKINFSDRENAISEYNDAAVLGCPRMLFAFNESRKCYELLKISMF